MSKWTVFIEYLELNQKLYCLEHDDRRIANITKEQFESFERLLSKAPEQPPAGELLPWQQSLLDDYDQRRFLELIERYNHKLAGVWDKDFTINGERLLEIISYGWGATFSLDRSEASREALLDACRELVKFCYPDGKWRGWDNMKGILEIMQPVRRLAEKEVKK